ncbi:MAG: hypothetical protein PVJ63_12330 [Thioalkalispiraceae bacterium]
MKRITSTLSLIIIMTINSHPVWAADIANGKSLHDGNCIHCHASLLGGDGTAIYTRENRKIESYAALDKQVRRCRDSLGMPWPEEQILDVINYLNENFYHFKKEE